MAYDYGRDEVLDHPNLIAYFAKWLKPNLFLEYGVREGETTRHISQYSKEVWGVDVVQTGYTHPNFTQFKMSTREFKKILDEKKPVVDMAFIDADHKFTSVIEDFNDIFPYVIEDGLIFLHDTYPNEERYTNPIKCNDCWKVPGVLEKLYGRSIELLTVPVQPGLTIIKKKRKIPLEWMRE